MAGNFNGNADLVNSATSLGNYGTPEVYLGDGDGTFSGQSYLWAYEGGDSANVAGDFNHDGNLDVAYQMYEPPGSFLVDELGDGNGTFEMSQGMGVVIVPTMLVTDDFNNDGVLDLALVGGGLQILLGNGDGTFTPAATQPVVTTVDPVSVTAGDFNGDGILDLAIADAGSSALTILQGNGDGTFTQVTGEPALPQPSNFVTTADLNGDGKLDLVFSSAANTISIFLGNGDGTFQPGLIEAMDYAPYGVAVGDFNGDGRLDLAVTNSDDNSVSILRQTPVRTGATVTLASLHNPVTLNQPVNYTAVVWATPTMPTGSVTFEQGATILGIVPLADGQARLTTTFTALGTFSIVASYSGDQNYSAKNSQAVKQVVGRYPSHVEINSSGNISYGQAVTLTSDVSSQAPTQPTGTVTFTTGGTSLGTVPLVTGVAVLTKKNLSAGAYWILATYNGDALNSNGTSENQAQLIVYPAQTATTLTSSPNPSVVGQNVRFKATVSSPTVVPVGTITFTAGATTLGTVSLAKGQATLTTSELPMGATTVTATYNGTSNITGSSGSVVQKVN